MTLRSREELTEHDGKIVCVDDAQRRQGYDRDVDTFVNYCFCEVEAVNSASQDGSKGCEHQCDLRSVKVSSSHED